MLGYLFGCRWCGITLTGYGYGYTQYYYRALGGEKEKEKGGGVNYRGIVGPFPVGSLEFGMSNYDS